tara:strand:+ start:419 stop:1117 length:699 start_codon:yes stop_codon:yes gene_type:complete
MKTPLLHAIERTKNLDSSDKMNFKGGKQYTQVATRVEMIREAYGENCQILTSIVECNDKFVLMKAEVCILKDSNWEIIATGHAEEYRQDRGVNSNSALENCETSAIGRALAACGIHGGEFASSFEVDNATNGKPETLKVLEQNYQHDYQATCMKHLESIVAIKSGIAYGEYSSAAEAWFELNAEEKEALWKAPSKGGCFTTKEREFMQSTEFREANPLKKDKDEEESEGEAA